jgi:outer membrane receptor protein involved in Fe transport
MKTRTAIFNVFLVLTLFPLALSAQPNSNPPVRGNAIITGQVWNQTDNQPVEYANVVLYRQRDSSVVNGTVTDARGKFTLAGLPPGRYYLEVSFIGFRTNRVRNLQLAPSARIDLGKIPLEPAVISMPGVEATAEKPKLEFRIDRKVINVAQNPALQTGTAADALENAPAVRVDLEGNVTLRGLSSFTVLVDGRPSPLEGSEALKQIPASTIDRIEIVTNPSVKYDPEGKAGIINVILKKQRPSGISGILNLNAGTSSQYNGNLLLSLKTGITTLFISPSIFQGGFPGTREMKNWTLTRTGDTAFRASTGSMRFIHRFYGIRAGADFQFSPHDWLSLNTQFGGSDGRRTQIADYFEWLIPAAPVETLKYRGGTVSQDNGSNYSASLDAGHNFGKPGHDLTLRASFGARHRQDSTVTADSTAGTIRTGTRTTEEHQGRRLDFKLDYSLPLREKDKFEAGYQTSYRFGPEQKTSYARYDTALGQYVSDPTWNHQSEQQEMVHALYSSYSFNYRGFGAMAGLRAEYSGRRVEIDNQTSTPLNQWDLFPSLHLSYSFPQEQQLMASYTRRIDRPRGWDLSPSITWMDARNVRQGNPALKPEYIDSYEAGLVLPFGTGRLSLDGYTRITHNVIQRLQRIYQDDIILHTVTNAGTDQALGLETNLDLTPFRWWNLNLSADIYDYRLKTQDTVRRSFNWEAGLTTDFTLPTMTRLQLQARYESPTATAQGSEGGRIWTGLSLRQALFKRQLIINLSARDLLATTAFENKTTTPEFFTWSRFSRRGPNFSLGITWNFNNYKQERRRSTNGEEEEQDTTPLFEY